MICRDTVADFRRGARSVSNAVARVRGVHAVVFTFRAVATWWNYIDLSLAPLEFVLATMEMCDAMREVD